MTPIPDWRAFKSSLGPNPEWQKPTRQDCPWGDDMPPVSKYGFEKTQRSSGACERNVMPAIGQGLIPHSDQVVRIVFREVLSFNHGMAFCRRGEKNLSECLLYYKHGELQTPPNKEPPSIWIVLAVGLSLGAVRGRSTWGPPPPPPAKKRDGTSPAPAEAGLWR